MHENFSLSTCRIEFVFCTSTLIDCMLLPIMFLRLILLPIIIFVEIAASVMNLMLVNLSIFKQVLEEI